MATKKSPRLTRDDWAAAALDAWTESDLGKVAVEPVAARLGATKGSFYWHFRSRDDLVLAALERWRDWATERVIAELDTVRDPKERLRLLFGNAMREWPGAHLDRVVLAAATSPLVEPVVREVTQRRITFMAELYAGMGLPRDTAHSRALLAYATYVGMLNLRGVLPDQTRHDLLVAVDTLVGS